MHILLVEDDALVASGIIAGLRLHAMTVDYVTTAKAAQSLLQMSHFDIIVLDLGLPDEDGMNLLRRLRNLGNSLPILVLTARDDNEHRIAGLQAGADDYLLKSFGRGGRGARGGGGRRRGAGRGAGGGRRGPL